MGIQVEFNPDLALRNIAEFKNGRRQAAECIPEQLVVGQIYPFLKRDQRNYWLLDKISLLETQGSAVLSRPLASIIILEATHFLENSAVYTKGRYQVVEIFHDDKIHFEGFVAI